MSSKEKLYWTVLVLFSVVVGSYVYFKGHQDFAVVAPTGPTTISSQ